MVVWKIDKIDKPLAGLNKKRERARFQITGTQITGTQITSIRNKRRAITISSTEILKPYTNMTT